MSELDEMGDALELECFTPEMRAAVERERIELEIKHSERLVRDMKNEEARDAFWSAPQLHKFLPPKDGFDLNDRD